MLTIKKTVEIEVPVEILEVNWHGSLAGKSLQDLQCTACSSKLGPRMWALAWCVDDGKKRSLRLCQTCAMKAESALEEENP